MAARPAGKKAPGSQDWVAVEREEGDSSWINVHVADGHGDKAHIRSGVGSELACDASIQAAATLAESARQSDRLETQRFLQELVGRQITRKWSADIRDHLEEVAPRQTELDALECSETDWAVRYLEQGGTDSRSVEKLYGTTLLGFLGGPSFAAAWQIGDGIVAVVDSDGEVTFPLEVDGQPLGDVTESLATGGAPDLFRTQAWWENSANLRLIALMTDGVEKAYASHVDLADDLRRIAATALTLQPEAVSLSLSTTAQNLAMKASNVSGDDATLAFLFRCSADNDLGDPRCLEA